MNSGSTGRLKSNEGEDIISNLPEPIISQILSRFSIRDAVRTSVLSKTWVCRWTCVTNLELNDQVFYLTKNKPRKHHFADFVTRTLLLTSNSSVESFRLVLKLNNYGPSLVNTWISNILNRDVKKLTVCSEFDLDFSVVSSHLLFNNYNLEELVLKLNVQQGAIRVPKPNVYFRHLKFLDLSLVTFIVDFPSDSKDVILDLPVLEEFKTVQCGWLSAKCVTLKVPLLERLFILHGCKQSTDCGFDDCAFNVCAPRMAQVTCGGCTSLDIFMVDPPLANGVVANITLCKCKEATVQRAKVRACKLLEQFSQAKCLKLTGPMLLLKSNGFLHDLPQFGMLSHLEFTSSFSCEILLSLLHKSPFLKTLDIKTGISQFHEEILNSASVPNCLLSTLESVKFGVVYGMKHELWLAKFVMENGLVLKRMSFSHSKWPSDLKRFEEEFKPELFSFKKGSSCVNLEFNAFH